MNKHLAFAAALLLASFPAFAGTGQLSPSSQFHLRFTRPAAKMGPKTVARRIKAAKPGPLCAVKTPKASKNSLKPTNSETRHTNVAAVAPGFVGASQIPLSGTNDDYTSPVMGDFNGDGKMDAAQVVFNSDCGGDNFSLSVVLSNGNGTFQAAQLTPMPNNLDDALAVADLNGDHKDDIVVLHTTEPASVDLLLSNGDGTFAAPVNYSVSDVSVNGGVLADIDADGKLDILAVDNSTPAKVITLPGNGDGTFQAATQLTTLADAAPGQLLFADLNGNGKLDIEGNRQGQAVVYLATSSGFADPVLLDTPNGVHDACTDSLGDLTGDGRAEIVSSNCGDDSITVYVNNGDGSFQTGVYYAVAGNVAADSPGLLFNISALIADADGDGKADIISTNYNGADVTILHGNGDGTVVVPTVGYATGGYPFAPALVADFNGDGLPDLLVQDDAFSLVYLQGYGDGTFRAANDYYGPTSGIPFTPNFGISIATADFNGDGIQDVVMGQYADPSLGVTVFLGNPDGSLQPGVNYGSGGTMFFVTVCDFNGDHKPDIAATDIASGVVQVFMGNGDGTFTLGGAFPTDSAGDPNPITVAAGDFNHDGNIDLAIANANNGNVAILLGDGTGAFSPPTTYSVGDNIAQMTVADLNQDGYLDIVAVVSDEGNVVVFLGNTDNSGTFQPGNDVSIPFNFLSYAAVGDLNGDGKPDLAITSEDSSLPGVIIALGNGDGTFQPATLFPTTLQDTTNYDICPYAVKIADIDLDGIPDVVVTNSNLATVSVLLGLGDGTLSSTPVEFPAGGYTFDLAITDINNDGALDFITADDDFAGVTVSLNTRGSKTLPDYTLAAATSTATVTAGSSANYSLLLAGTNGYNGTITFTCSGLPALAACSFSPSSIVAQGKRILATAVTITTTATTTAGLSRPAGPQSGNSAPVLAASLGGLGLFGLMFAGFGRKQRRRQMFVLLGCLLVLITLTLVGCGRDSDDVHTTPGTAAGNYTIVVTSTGTGVTAPTHSVSLTLVVQ